MDRLWTNCTEFKALTFSLNWIEFERKVTSYYHVFLSATAERFVSNVGTRIKQVHGREKWFSVVVFLTQDFRFLRRPAWADGGVFRASDLAERTAVEGLPKKKLKVGSGSASSASSSSVSCSFLGTTTTKNNLVIVVSIAALGAQWYRKLLGCSATLTKVQEKKEKISSPSSSSNGTDFSLDSHRIVSYFGLRFLGSSKWWIVECTGYYLRTTSFTGLVSF